MPRAVEVIGQRARVRPSCRARVPRQELQLIRRPPFPSIGTKRRGRRGTDAHKSLISARLREFRCWFLISVKVGNESGAPARWPRTLHTPSIDPVAVVFSVKRENVVHTRPQRALDGAETSKHTVTIRDGGATGSLAASLLVGSSALCCLKAVVAGICSKSRVQASAGCWTWKCDRPHHRRMMSPNPSQHISCRNHQTLWHP